MKTTISDQMDLFIQSLVGKNLKVKRMKKGGVVTEITEKYHEMDGETYWEFKFQDGRKIACGLYDYFEILA